MKRLLKGTTTLAYLFRSGACFCSESPNNPTYHAFVCILEWFILSDGTKVEDVLPNAHLMHSQQVFRHRTHIWC